MVGDDHQRVRMLLKALAAELKMAAPKLDRIRQWLRELEPLDMPHQAWESELFFPKVRQRCPALGPVLDRVQSEHREMETLYRQLVSEVDALGACQRQSVPAGALIARLERFTFMALGHMEVEERYIMPVAQDFLTAGDWVEIGGVGGPHRK